MKYNTLKATFKSGLISPRLRGREKDGDISSGAEKIENFFIDKVGGASKRGSLEWIKRQPFNNATAGTYDSRPLADTALGIEYFAVNLKGRDFLFRFKTTNSLNSVRTPLNASSVADYQSNFLDVIELLPSQPAVFNGDTGYCDVRPFAPYVTGSYSYTNNPDLTAFTQVNIAGPSTATTYLKEYLNNMKPNNLSMTKVSNATVVFVSRSTSTAESITKYDGPSFTVSLVNLPVTSGSTTTSEVFVILPYFVNVRAFVANLGKAIGAANYYNPIHPSNFPFNPVNTNPAFTITATLNTSLGTQSGADGTVGQLINTTNKMVYDIAVPLAICVDADYAYGTDVNALIGKFLIMPTTNNLYDVVFLITAHKSTVGTTATFYGLIITSGSSTAGAATAPATATTLWKVSTFGGQSHPRAACYFQGRLLYGNDGINQSRWWASGIHPSNLANFQGFMGFALTHDASSDVSLMQYQDVSVATVKTNYQDYGISDPFRWGFTDNVPNLSPIYFIEARTRIHFGTIAGETQLLVGDGVYNKASYNQTLVRSNSAAPYITTRGDGKFFYISNGGKDIRFISTEDKDYESLDGLMTTALEGMDIKFTKIVWFEKLSSIIALSEDKRLFLITAHEDTQIKAITEFTSELDILDFFCTLEDLYLVVGHKNYQLVTRYVKEYDIAGDLCLRHTGLFTDLSFAYPPFLGDTMYIYFEGVEYEVTIPANGSAPTLPVDPADATDDNPLYIYGKKVTAKIKTPPINEGGAGANSAMGDVTRIDRAVIQVDNSGPFRIGNENGTIYDAEGLDISTMSTKLVKFDMPQSPDIENHLYIETDKPTPLNISGVSYRGLSNDGA